MGGELAEEQEGIDTALLYRAAEFAMGLFGVGAQFPHVAEHGDLFTSPGLREGEQGRFHRFGIGIVGIVDDGDPLPQGDYLHPHGRRLEGLEPPFYFLHPDPLRKGGCRGCQGIIDLVASHELQGDGYLPRRSL